MSNRYPVPATPSSLPTGPADNKIDPSTQFPPGEFMPDERPCSEGAEPIVNRSFTPAGPGGEMCNGSNPPASNGTILNKPIASWPSKSPGLSNDGHQG